MSAITVLGSGSWGTALALHAHRLGHAVALWTPSEQEYQEISRDRANQKCLPGHTIPGEIHITKNLETGCRAADALILAIPSHALRSVMENARPWISPGTALITAVKGIETHTLMRMSEILEALFAEETAILALSGPSFAVEVSRGDPTAIVLACKDYGTALRWQRELSGANVRLYGNQDMVGTELGGAVKNVIAIAAGVLAGLGFGFNTIAALITRGLSEMQKLCVAAGGKASTMAGLAGLGDLVLTCTGGPSRNRQVGISLGQGGSLEAILEQLGQVVEGVKTAESTLGLARRYQVEMPIVRQVYATLYEGVSPRRAIEELMNRQLKMEEWS